MKSMCCRGLLGLGLASGVLAGLGGCNIQGDASQTTVVEGDSAEGLKPLVGRVVTVYLSDAPESVTSTGANWPMRPEDVSQSGVNPQLFMGLVLGDGQPLRARGVLHEVRGDWLVLRAWGDDAGRLGEVILPARAVRAIFAEMGEEEPATMPPSDGAEEPATTP